MPVAATPVSRRGSPAEVLSAFLRLGCMSFGGPIAHLGYFRTELVHRRGWVSDQLFAELVALAQSMPGPASSAQTRPIVTTGARAFRLKSVISATAIS